VVSQVGRLHYECTDACLCGAQCVGMGVFMLHLSTMSSPSRMHASRKNRGKHHRRRSKIIKTGCRECGKREPNVQNKRVCTGIVCLDKPVTSEIQKAFTSDFIQDVDDTEGPKLTMKSS
jgi:hypothetical protein